MNIELTMLDKPFVVYGTFSVQYSGRANSDLEKGQYLLIRKIDGAFLVLGSTLVTPRNYMGPGSTVSYAGSILLVRNKKSECLTITVHKILNILEPEGWSKNRITLSKSERDLVNKIVADIDKYIPGNTLLTVEYQTKFGSIDIYVENPAGQNIIEVKRGRINLSACSQISRYLELFPGAQGYLMAPDIGQNALRWCEEHNVKYIKVNY